MELLNGKNTKSGMGGGVSAHVLAEPAEAVATGISAEFTAPDETDSPRNFRSGFVKVCSDVELLSPWLHSTFWSSICRPPSPARAGRLRDKPATSSWFVVNKPQSPRARMAVIKTRLLR